MPFNIWLQSRLTAHGFHVGLIDGEIGPVTISALQKFQKRAKLPATGKADDATIAALRTTSSAIPLDLMPKIAAIRDKVEVPKASARWPRQSEVVEYFGQVGTRQTRLDLPFAMKLAWDKSQTIKAVTIHEKVAPSAARCFARIAGAFDEKERATLGIDIFGGSFNVRKMRGGSSYSMHSWGIAIDFDPERNQLQWGKDKARLGQRDAIPFWKIWEDEGWLSLGRARNFDWMHVQAAVL